MTKRRLVTLVVLGISLIVAIVTTFSYAYWTKSVNQTGENEITALGCFEIEYTDTEEINIDKAYPISDEKGKAQEVKYTFTLTNTCDVLMQTQINIESLDVSGKALPNNYVKAYLTSNNKDITITKLDNSIKVENLEEDVRETYKLETGWLRPHATKTYELRIWVASDVEYTDDSYNATFKGKIHIAPSIYDGDLAMLDSRTTSDTRFFRSSTYREKIKTLTFEKGINIPENSTEVWDIGVSSAPELIKAYIVPVSEGSSYYDLHIQSDDQMFANEDMTWWFADLRYLDSINGLDVIDFSTTTNMSNMFGGNYYHYSPGYSSSIFSVDVSSIDTSNVTNMSNMFATLGWNNPNFTIDVSRFNTSKVTTMSDMFDNTGRNSRIFNLDLSNFDTSNVTNMSYMFCGAGYSNPSFTLDISNLDTSNVTNMSYMFLNTGYNNPSFTLDVSTLDTSKVIDMTGMFYNTGFNSTIFTLDVSNFDTSNVIYMGEMFYYYVDPYYGATAVPKSTVYQIDISDFDTSNVTNMARMFYYTGYSNLKFTLDVSNFDTSKVTYMTGMFSNTGYNSTIFDLDVSNFDTSKVTNMSSMFYETGYNSTVLNLDVSNFDTSNVTNMYSMFESAGYSNPNFTLDVSGFDTTNVTDMSYMFYRTGYNNTEFTLDVSNFDTSQVTNMSGMFNGLGYNNINFTLDLSNFDTSNVTYMGTMFSETGFSNSNFTLDLSNFDTSKVTSMNSMFDSHPYLKIKFGDNFNTSKVTSMYGMFSNIDTLKLENYQRFDTTNVNQYGYYSDSYYGMFENCKNVSIVIDIYTLSTRVYNSNYYRNMFKNAATEPGAEIIVNYTLENESLVDLMIATKSENSNVIKGSSLDKDITINTENVTSNPTKAIMGNTVTLTPTTEERRIKSFKMNGDYIEGDTFVMPRGEAIITDVEFYYSNAITVPDTVTANVTNSFKDYTITLTPVETDARIVSFKLNGETINNNYFIMPDEEAIITDVEIEYKHAVTIPDTITASYSTAYRGYSIYLSSKSSDMRLKSFKVNGTLINGNSFTMPNEEAIITDVEFDYKHTITIPDIITSSYTTSFKDNTIYLYSKNSDKIVKSFKLNGEYIEGNRFTMPDEDVEITDVEFYDRHTITMPSTIYGNYSTAFCGYNIYLYSNDSNKLIKSYKLNGEYTEEREFTMLDEDVVITDVEFYDIHTITIPDTINSNYSSAFYGYTVNLTPKESNRKVKSFKLNGELISDDHFTMLDENVEITEVEFYFPREITIPDTITISSSNPIRGDIIMLDPVESNKMIESFKVNGELVEGDSFIMLDENIEITDVVFVDCYVAESAHNPYPNSVNYETYYEELFEGATAIRIKLKYQTEGTSWDYVYLYDEEGSTTPYGGTSNKYGGKTLTTQTITLNSDYIKIVFRTDSSVNSYYGFKAWILPIYD